MRAEWQRWWEFKLAISKNNRDFATKWKLSNEKRMRWGLYNLSSPAFWTIFLIFFLPRDIFINFVTKTLIKIAWVIELNFNIYTIFRSTFSKFNLITLTWMSERSKDSRESSQWDAQKHALCCDDNKLQARDLGIKALRWKFSS